MRDAGLQEELWAYGDRAWRREALQERVEAIVRERLQDRRSLPTAIVAHDDFMALSVLQIAREAGLSVPQDLSILGHDDTLVTQLVTPRLSSISIPIKRIGRAAARLALRLSGVEIDHPGEPTGKPGAGLDHWEFSAVPTWRESTAPPRPAH